MKAYHLFISHSWTYADQYNNLVNLLDQAKNFHYHNYSIPNYDPVHVGSDRELSKAIHNQMQPCGIVLVLAGVYASYSKWIDKEIKIARSGFSRPKPILAIEPWIVRKLFGRQRKCRPDRWWNTKVLFPQ